MWFLVCVFLARASAALPQVDPRVSVCVDPCGQTLHICQVLRTSASPYACARVRPTEVWEYQLSLVTASPSLSPICWHVLLCGYTQPNKAHNISLWTGSRTETYLYTKTHSSLGGCHCRISHSEYKMHVRLRASGAATPRNSHIDCRIL